LRKGRRDRRASARASRIDVSLGQRDGSLVLSISAGSREDNGTQITAQLPLEASLPTPAG
jgi:hypothetical protein